MTLTQVLLRYVLKASLIIVGISALFVGIFFGLDAAIGTIVGAALSIGDAAAMIYLIGELLSPARFGTRKVVLTAILVLKLAVVGGLLWLAVDRFGVSGLGLVLGIGIGLTATVIGASRGSASQAGQQAIARAESMIAKEMEDSGNQTR
jgi:hypothetical protein